MNNAIELKNESDLAKVLHSKAAKNWGFLTSDEKRRLFAGLKKIFAHNLTEDQLNELFANDLAGLCYCSNVDPFEILLRWCEKDEKKGGK